MTWVGDPLGAGFTSRRRLSLASGNREDLWCLPTATPEQTSGTARTRSSLALAAEPIEKMEPTEATEPIDRIVPTEPIDKIDPLDPMLRSEPADPADRYRYDGILASTPISGN